MNWLSPDEAEQAVLSLIAAGWLEGEEDALRPAIALGDANTPLGWHPRPRRLLSPVSVVQAQQEAEQDAEVVDEQKAVASPATVSQTTPQPVARPAVVAPVATGDPRAKLAARLAKFIAKSSKVDIAEIQRRADRKKSALSLATDWICLALVAREQGIQMDAITDALSVR